jgi:NhaA family Na+:H+ antiporter
VDGLAVAGLGLTLLFLLLKIGVRPGFIFTIPILIMWAGMLKCGIHPAIAGVIAGLIAPAKSWYGKEGFLKAARDILDDFQTRIDRDHEDHELFEPLTRLSRARKEALSPALRMELALHPWVAYVIMPVFAIANAGVDLRGVDLQAPGFVTISAGVIFGLVVGKPLGIVLMSWVAVRIRLCSLPDGVNWRGMFVAGAGAGIGFTMAIFIAELAFTEPAMLGIAKLSILVATAVAATIALVSGRILLTAEQLPGEMPHATLADVESDTEYWTGNYATPALSKRNPSQ